MKEAAERLSLSARHLSLIDQICEDLDPEYAEIKAHLLTLPGYQAIADQLYEGQVGRQMVLGDLLTYILAGRGYWTAGREEEAFRGYVEVIMHTVNLVWIQESILSTRPAQRQQFMERLAAENLEHFYANATETQRYQDLAGLNEEVFPGHALYRVMDSLLPKSAGVAIELLVYVYLLKRAIGYVVPLLFTQRLFRGPENFAPPDYLVLRPGGQVVGVEVGGGLGIYGAPSRGKLEQVNRFVQDTSIPVITATMPHVGYRCPTCRSWPLFCPEVVERVTGDWDGEEALISCPTCPRYEGGACPYILYRGQTEVGGDTRHYHYSHVKDSPYVQERSLRTEELRAKKLVSYFPLVNGLERLPRT